MGKYPGYDQLVTSPVHYATSTLDMASNVARNTKPPSSLLLARLRERGRRGSRGLSVIGGGGRGGGWLVSWLVGWCLTRVFRLLLLEKN